MSFLVFDIETSAVPFESLEESQQEYIVRGATTEEERASKIAMMSLNPLTARVVALGMIRIASLDDVPQGCVYSNCGEEKAELREEENLDDGSIWKTMSERELFERWWELLGKRTGRESYHLITFNGRNFDAPFMMLRSMLLRVKPTRNLMDGTKFNYANHTDLQEELAFKGFDRNGALRRFNFDFYCKAFGIPSPKGGGITGQEVPEFFAAGRHREIASYCLRDVWATWELYKLWREYLS